MSTTLSDDKENESTETLIGGGEAFRRLTPHLLKHRKRLLFSFGLLLLVTLGSIAWPLLVQRTIDGPLSEGVANGGSAFDWAPLILLGLAVFFIQAVTVYLQYVQRVNLETIGQDIMLGLRTKLFGHVLRQDVSFFDRQPVGRLMARVESDTESLRLLFTNVVILVIGDLLLMVGIAGLMFATHARLAAALVSLYPITALTLYVFHRITTPRFLAVRTRMAEVTATLTEFLHGIAIIQIFHRGEYVREKLRQVNEEKFKVQAYAEVAVCVLFNTVFFFEFLKIGLVLLLGSLWHVTPGVTVLFILLIWKEFEPIARTADQLSSFQKGVAGARKIFSLLSVKPSLQEPEQPVSWSEIKKGIRFENVWFSYSNDENWVLKDVSFELPVGSHIALAGVTGGGKSTIISLLLRLYDPQRGRITIDGIDIREIATADLRRRFALVLQDILLFPGDVESNITLESEAIQSDRVKEAARIVGADQFIRRLPRAYKTVVSENGANFSRGERQLLSFARALAVDPDLLILDEATGSVDPETERTIQKSLTRLMKGRTSIIIAHRLSTILHVDRILVIREGRIVETGSHSELVTQDGYYAKLFRLQFGSRIEPGDLQDDGVMDQDRMEVSRGA